VPGLLSIAQKGSSSKGRIRAPCRARGGSRSSRLRARRVTFAARARQVKAYTGMTRALSASSVPMTASTGLAPTMLTPLLHHVRTGARLTQVARCSHRHVPLTVAGRFCRSMLRSNRGRLRSLDCTLRCLDSPSLMRSSDARHTPGQTHTVGNPRHATPNTGRVPSGGSTKTEGASCGDTLSINLYVDGRENPDSRSNFLAGRR